MHLSGPIKNHAERDGDSVGIRAISVFSCRAGDLLFMPFGHLWIAFKSSVSNCFAMLDIFSFINLSS